MSIFGIFERKVRIVMASPMLTLLVGIGKDRAAFQVESLARVMPLMHIGAHRAAPHEPILTTIRAATSPFEAAKGTAETAG